MMRDIKKNTKKESKARIPQCGMVAGNTGFPITGWILDQAASHYYVFVLKGLHKVSDLQFPHL